MLPDGTISERLSTAVWRPNVLVTCWISTAGITVSRWVSQSDRDGRKVCADGTTRRERASSRRAATRECNHYIGLVDGTECPSGGTRTREFSTGRAGRGRSISVQEEAP